MYLAPGIRIIGIRKLLGQRTGATYTGALLPQRVTRAKGSIRIAADRCSSGHDETILPDIACRHLYLGGVDLTAAVLPAGITCAGVAVRIDALRRGTVGKS